MDRTHTKRKSARVKRPRRAKENRPQSSAARLRLYACGALIVCLIGLILLTGGSTAERLMQFALPLLHTVPRGPNTSEQPAAPISITRVDIDEGVSEKMRIEVLSPKDPVITPLSGDAPRILIYHTHTTEAYTMTDTYKYQEAGQWRTHEQDKSIVAVGELLAKTLSEQYGCNVIHDTTDHEPPKLATSYSRSVETMLAYKKQYPSLTMFIDVHRDAGKDRSTVTIDGKQVAKMMFVVGTGEGATGTGFKEMPDFESNFALANAITENLRLVNSGLMRNIRVKTGRYNQHVSSQCLLVEMGDNANTLDDVLNAVPYLARAIVDVMGGETQPASAPLTQATPTPEAAPGMLWAPKE